MPRTLICDTNVFYDLGEGRIAPNDFIQPGDQVAYSPVTVLELAGKMSDKTHQARKAAARIILDLNAQQLPDPELFLTITFGYEPTEQPVDLQEAVVAIAQSNDMAQLRAGVPDYVLGVKRTMKLEVAEKWREDTEKKWVDDHLLIMKREIPGFEAWYKLDVQARPQAVPRLAGADAEAFHKKAESHEFLAACLLACQERAFFKAKRDSLQITPDAARVLAKAIDKVELFCRTYAQYQIRLLTERALPKRNDSGDIEFLYYSSDPDHIVVTSEGLWHRLADRAGLPNRLVKPKP